MSFNGWQNGPRPAPKLITDRAGEIAVERFGSTNVTNEQALHTLGAALIEYQAATEERIARLENQIRGLSGSVYPQGFGR